MPQWGQNVKDFRIRIQNDLDKLEKGSKIAQGGSIKTNTNKINLGRKRNRCINIQ